MLLTRQPSTRCSMSERDDVDSSSISHPRHYQGNGKVECMDALNSMLYDVNMTGSQAYWSGCVLKYLWRWSWKNGLEDLKKARQCLDYLIADVQSNIDFIGADKDGDEF